jgi:CrcB protein
MNPLFILAGAAGSAIGSVMRYLVGIASGKLLGTNFPWGTLIINVTGSLIGTFVGLFAKWDLPQAARIFLTVGICGRYTTFSTFSLDAWVLRERGETFASAAYMIGSVVLSVGALIAAMQIIRAQRAERVGDGEPQTTFPPPPGSSQAAPRRWRSCRGMGRHWQSCSERPAFYPGTICAMPDCLKGDLTED